MPLLPGGHLHCNSCAYQTHIYSNLEWLEAAEEKCCEKCKGTHKKHFDEGIIYRHDLGNSNQDIPLYM